MTALVVTETPQIRVKIAPLDWGYCAAALTGVALEMGGTWIDPHKYFAWAEAQR